MLGVGVIVSVGVFVGIVVGVLVVVGVGEFVVVGIGVFVMVCVGGMGVEAGVHPLITNVIRRANTIISKDDFFMLNPPQVRLLKIMLNEVIKSRQSSYLSSGYKGPRY